MVDGGRQGGRDATDALAYPRATMAFTAKDCAALCHQYGFFEGVAGGGLHVAVAAEAGQGLVVAVRAVKALALRAAGGEGHRRVARAGEQVAAVFCFGDLVFAKAGAGVAAVAAVAEVCKDAHQFVVADACRVVQEVELPRTARAIPVLFAAVGGNAPVPVVWVAQLMVLCAWLWLVMRSAAVKAMV